MQGLSFWKAHSDVQPPVVRLEKATDIVFQPAKTGQTGQLPWETDIISALALPG